MAKVALLIGVSEYEPGLNPLPAAVKDIEAMRRVLQDPEMGGFDQVKTLANPDRQTMASEIELLFGGRAKDDLVLLFFSGHGIKDDASTLYFASRNTQKSDKGDLIRSTALETRFVHDIMNDSRAKRQAIILDCCFSGAFDPAFQSKDDGSVDLQTQLGAEGRVVLTSSSSTQYSFEQQGSELSIYTRYLVEGIETGAGDSDSDGFVSMLELHEYAASKVQETAPKMTPKIIVLKDKGFEIVLAKARVTDPKLNYRKTATRYANAGTIRPAGRAVLNTLRQQLGLSLGEAAEIEAEVLRPYQERLVNLQQYWETLIAEAEHEYPLGEFAREDLNTLQQMLGLRDEDVLPVQQEVERQFAQQLAAYQQNLIQYEQTLADAIQKAFPLSEQAHQGLERLQQSLGLRDEDITRVCQPLIQQAELRHQENLRQEAERQEQEAEDRLRQEREEVERQQAEAERQQQAADRLRQEQEEADRVAHQQAAERLAQDHQRKAAEALAQKRAEEEALSSLVRQPDPKLNMPRLEAGQRLLEVKLFNFEVATLGNKGQEVSRTSHTSKYFSEDLGQGVELAMVAIPGGAFFMGSLAGEGDDSERPQHEVNVQPFYLGKYPVTQTQWRAVAAMPQVAIELNPDPSNFKGENRPVEQVSWHDAIEFCARLSRYTDRRYRLPSEAEWEYACRAGTTTPFHFGPEITQKYVNCKRNVLMALATIASGETTDVGNFKLANTFGLYDMHGNVWEWCADHWHGNYNGAPTDGTAWLSSDEATRRLLRGGSWLNNPWVCRSADRLSNPPDNRYFNIGFRVVCAAARAL